jgi:hypothetical protein
MNNEDKDRTIKSPETAWKGAPYDPEEYRPFP